MDFQDIFGETKWSLLKELSQGSKSATDLAKKTNMSVANATIHLNLLQAKGIIKKAKCNKEKKTGKPKKPFELQEDIILTGILRNGLAERKVVKARDLGEYERFALATLFTMDPDTGYCAARYCLESGMLRKAEVIGFLKSEGNEIELFIVSDHYLPEIREQHSNTHIETLSGKTKKIISWSHNRKEIEEGLEKGEPYFLNLVKSQELLDKKGLLREWGK